MAVWVLCMAISKINLLYAELNRSCKSQLAGFLCKGV